MNASEFPHEERLISLLGFMKKPELRLQSILAISEEWPVPWTNGISQLVDTTLSSSVGNFSSECKQILETLEFVKIKVPYKCIIRKYKLTAAKLIHQSSVYVS